MLMDIEAAQDAETIAKLKKEKHDLKFEIRQLRERIDKIEQEHREMQKAVAILILHDKQCQEVVHLLTDTVTTLIKEMEEDK